MRAIAPVVLGPLLPSDLGARERALAASMATLDDYLAYMSPPIQRQACALLGLLNLLPVRRLLLGASTPWREVAPERIEAFLRRAHDSRFLVLRRVYDFLQSMSVLAWFDLVEAWSEVGYPGPPVERPDRRGSPW